MARGGLRASNAADMRARAAPHGRWPLTERDHRDPEVAALRERMSSLSGAVLRISASLDVDTVLREVVDSARALTGARYGIIATGGGPDAAREYVISGMTPGQARRLETWPEAERLFEHFRGLGAPLRLADLPRYVRSLGFSGELMLAKTFQGTPMRHRGAYVGTFFLAGKAGGEAFDDDDEEVLVLFAAQAAIAIANARAHRDERRARADLEALVETSPVGVVVFDPKTRMPAMANREARRMAEALRPAGGSAEELVNVLAPRLAPGRDPGVDPLGDAGTLRAAEIELAASGGRALRVLVNATPIRAADGAVESVVVTMQDLAALEELDRLRADFLAMVSHELRAPLAAIRGSAVTLLEDARDLDAAERRGFLRIIAEQTGHMRRLVGDLLDAGRIDAGALPLEPEPREVAALVERARTAFRGGGRREVRVDLPPDLPPVLADERRVAQVLNNLLSNAARHSPESSTIHVGAARDGPGVAVWVADEGRGIAPGRLPHLFRRYADAAGGDGDRKPAGFGLGLAICKGIVEAHGGRIRAESAGPGLGARFTFTLPAAGEPAAAAGDARGAGEERGPVPVLVVDDDPETLRHVRDALAAAGYAPLVTGDADDAARLVRTGRPRLVVLDLVLPGTDGIELMRSVPEMADLPVIFISAYGRDETVVRALDAGAADYVVKPFSAAELTARVRAALRRRAGAEPFALGALSIDYERRRVAVAGDPVHLTPNEYELLRVLWVGAGRVVTYASLRRQVWGDAADGDTEPVRGVVKRLRRKLGEDPANPAWIVNERGVGYRMRGPDEE